MFKFTVLAASMAAACALPFSAAAADNNALAQIREQVRQLKDNYEMRIQALEKRLQQAEEKVAQAESKVVPQGAVTVAAAVANTPVATAASRSANSFNPAISLILGGTYANLSQDPAQYRQQGFIPAGESGPGKRSFSLGESELSFSANIDHRFAGKLTVALAEDNSVGVEEAFVQAQGLGNGINLKGGRFLSTVGYINNQHAHTWDFVDAPLTYKTFLGGQYKTDGVQLKWLAPTDRFLELGLEAGNGASFPGNDRNKNGIGSMAIFAHVGDDMGDNASWRAGLSYLKASAANRSYTDTDRNGIEVTNAYSGNSAIWIADAVYKWAPNGNSTQRNFKLQGEYFRRNEKGALTYDTLAQSMGTAAGSYASAQSGWYLQGVLQFMPKWRTGLRYDKLYAGSPAIGLVDNGTLIAADFQTLSSYNPSRTSMMLDFSPSEFSRFRLQLARENSRPGVIDNQIFLQYIMSLGAHGAHSF